MGDRPPGRAVRGHADLADRVGEAAEVVEDEVEALPRARAVGGGVAHEDRGEVVVHQLAHAFLDEDLAARIGGLRAERGGLGAHLVAAGAVGRAGRGLDEAPDAGGARLLGQADRALVVDVHGEAGVVLADRVVRELGQVHHRVEALEVACRDPALVLGEHRRMRAPVVEEPAAPVVAGVEPDHLVAGLDELRAHDRADIAVGPGQEHAHGYSAARAGAERPQTFQGAWPESHISCRTCLSLSVSMFCQNPLWW